VSDMSLRLCPRCDTRRPVSDFYRDKSRPSGLHVYCTPCNKQACKGRTPIGVDRSTYWSWRAMISRCHCKSHTAYGFYGGRGISVCDEWRHDINTFIVDMGNRPSRSHTIDRIDVNGNYEPGNCRWATKKEQSNNTRKTITVTLLGVTKPLRRWCEEMGLNPRTIASRISNYKWDPVRALTEPVHVKFRKINVGH
jgi:hypothetical protein